MRIGVGIKRLHSSAKLFNNSMYAKGMSQRDIEDTIREIYGADVSQGMISRIADEILPAVNEWQNRPLASIYPVIFFDGIQVDFSDRRFHPEGHFSKCL